MSMKWPSPQDGRLAQHFEQQFGQILSSDLLPWLSNDVHEYRQTDQLELFLIRSHNQQMAHLPSHHKRAASRFNRKQTKTCTLLAIWSHQHFILENGWQEFEPWCHGQWPSIILGPEETTKRFLRNTSKARITNTKPAIFWTDPCESSLQSSILNTPGTNALPFKNLKLSGSF